MPKRFIAAYGKRTQKKAVYNKKTEKKGPGHKTPEYLNPENKKQKNEAPPPTSSTPREPENDQQGDNEIELFGPK
ncbi:MAG TPA: hypothetical protein DD405_02420 [Desulfobacteraceae bacterium]|nr:hypothetical protein [Desulfobacteraceae bacterium]